MAFTVLLHPKAARALGRIDESSRARIVESLHNLREAPEKVGKPLKHSDFRSPRIGKHRVIYETLKERGEVVILFVGHRKDVYDDFSRIV